MASRTNTDSIRDLEKQVAVHEDQLVHLWARFEKLEQNHVKSFEASKESEKKIAVLESQLAESKRSLEESDRKRWQLTAGLILAFVGLLINLAVSLWRK